MKNDSKQCKSARSISEEVLVELAKIAAIEYRINTLLNEIKSNSVVTTTDQNSKH